MVQFGGHLMYGGSGHTTTRIQRALVCVQTRKGRQQGRMNIEQPSSVTRNEPRGEDTHETSHHHEHAAPGLAIPIDQFCQGTVEVLPGGKCPVVQHMRRDAVFPCKNESIRLCLVADYGNDACSQLFIPGVTQGCSDYRCHVGAAARDQNDDVFHTDQIMTLTLTEARVLGTLMEKARTVPDSYPLTLNTLLLGCNQKTSRDPLMELDEARIAEALDKLKGEGLVRESSGGRTARYDHNFQRSLGVPEQSAVLLGLLMLRGPQTAGELRLNSDRWYKFADISSVEGFLEELQDRSEEKGGALVVKLERAAGAREQRWAHLLCGPVDVAQNASTNRSGSFDSSACGSNSQRLEQLETEVAQLRATVQRLCVELGMSLPGQT
jgi:uncharacterized protein YceH (UPF0502 family)